MSSLGIIKRIVPFLVTLIVGLFIASFFVDLTPRPLFIEGRRHRCQDFQNMYMQEHERRMQAEQELDRIRQNPIDLKHSQPWTNPNAFVPPPTVPKAIR
jgi:hypothetical protein